jgi:hypothetical protein
METNDLDFDETVIVVSALIEITHTAYTNGDNTDPYIRVAIKLLRGLI